MSKLNLLIFYRVAQADDFVKNLLNILQTVHKEGISQKIMCGFNRSDYMMNYDEETQTESPQQVEINMIASSLSCFSEKVGKLHSFVSCKFPEFSPYKSEPNISGQSLPKLLVKAHEVYGKGDCILFVKQHGEKSLDQIHLETAVIDQYNVPVVRLTLKEILDQCNLKDGKLMLGEKIISLVYFRAGYGPNDYPTQDEWDSRLLIERSDAIKCPTVSYQLCGTKKIQQVLNRPHMMEKFMKDDVLIERFVDCYTGIWALSPDDTHIIDLAIKHPDQYVLKQQREGGGNLIHGDQMKEILAKISPEDMKQYVLMKKIIPKANKVFLCRDSQVQEVMGVSELGIYGCFLGDGEKETVNEYGGYLMRTKMEGVEDGGVLAGAMFLDSVHLK